MCPYHNNGKCTRTVSSVGLPRDRIIHHCQGNYNSCPAYKNAVTGQHYTTSTDMYEQNKKSMRKGSGMRILALAAGVAAFFLFPKVGVDFPVNLGGALLVAFMVLMATNKWH